MRHPISMQDLAVGKNRNKSGVEVIKSGTQGFEENIRHGRSFAAYSHNDMKPDKIRVKQGNRVGKTHALKKILFTLLLEEQPAQPIDFQDADVWTFPLQYPVVLEAADDARYGFPMRTDPRGEVHKQRR